MTSARLIFTDLAANNNKFWNARVEGSTVVSEWGRIGEAGQRTVNSFASPERAEKAFNTKVREKLAKGYTEQRTVDGSAPVAVASIAHVARTQIKHNGDSETAKLIDFLIQRNIHEIEGATGITFQNGQATTPLGPVTEAGIAEAERLLDVLTESFNRQSFGSYFSRKVDEYLRIIPRKIGRKRTEARAIFPTQESVDQERQLLVALRAVLKDAEQRAATDAPLVFRTTLERVTDTDPEFARISKLFARSANSRHVSARMRLRRVWRVEIAGSEESFCKDLGNVRELWHGTSDNNLLSILKGGYVLPKQVKTARITGAMFGPGIYFSDQSTKSLNYATSFWGGTRSQRCFMLLNDVAMGREYRPTRPFSGTVPAGYDSCFAEAHKSGVINNEMVVYKTDQVRPKYLCEFE